MFDQPSRWSLSSLSKFELDLIDRLTTRYAAAAGELARITSRLHQATARGDAYGYLAIQQELRSAQAICKEHAAALRILCEELESSGKRAAARDDHDGDEANPAVHPDCQAMSDPGESSSATASQNEPLGP